MPTATLAIDVPEGTWIHAVTTTHPALTVRVLAVLPGPEHGTALAELRIPEPVGVLSALDHQSDVEALDLLWQYGDRALIQLQTAEPFLLRPIARAGVPIETPFDVREGVVELSLTTSNDRLSVLDDRLDEADLTYQLRSVEQAPGRDGDRLSDRQRETLLVATKMGYYELPRRTTLTEVADAMGIAKATASDLLHRAEGKLVDWYFEEHAVGESSGRETPAIPDRR